LSSINWSLVKIGFGIISNMRADISAKGKGTGNKILFLFRSLSNFCSISLKVIISGPTHSIIFEELLFEII
tara:strand:+ start:1222 stop:1434 length:213 start_codon:yes stop_codon:yes gene_type:complete